MSNPPIENVLWLDLFPWTMQLFSVGHGAFLHIFIALDFFSRPEIENLDQKLNLIADIVEDGTHPLITFTVFMPDTHKSGGAYVEITDSVKRVNTAQKKVILMTTEGYGHLNKTIDFGKITAVHGEAVDYLDDAIG